MTLTEFEQRLGAFGESIQDLQPTLTNIADLIEQDLKASYSSVGLKTGGPLWNSLKATATADTLTINMLDYGMYNNYGVMPTPSFKNGGQAPKETYFGRMFKYNDREFGLPRRQFFDFNDIENQIAEGIAIEITNNF